MYFVSNLLRAQPLRWFRPSFCEVLLIRDLALVNEVDDLRRLSDRIETLAVAVLFFAVNHNMLD